MRTRSVVALLMLSLAALSGAVPAARADVALGQPLPSFTKTLLGGGTVTPSQYSGKVLVLALVGYG